MVHLRSLKGWRRCAAGRAGWSAVAALAIAGLPLAAPWPVRAGTPDDAEAVANLGLRESPVALRDSGRWQEPARIVVAVDSEVRLAWLREATEGTGTRLVPARDMGELMAAIGEADGLVGPCAAEVVAAGEKLRWLQTNGVGVEQCMEIPAIRDGRVLLTNVPRLSAEAVADHAMALVLALARNLPEYDRNQRSGRWMPGPPRKMLTLGGKTLLVAGMGDVGKALALRARAFGMQVIGTSRTAADKPEYVSYLGKPEELGSLVARADVVVNATPLTKDTERMFDAAIFAQMKHTALFVNVGRGRSVVTDDLVRALRSGALAGAALDVVEPEPLPRGHPLWAMPNVVITPHVGDSAPDRSDRAWTVMRENLRRYIRGDRLLSVVDVARGY